MLTNESYDKYSEYFTHITFVERFWTLFSSRDTIRVDVCFPNELV